MLAAGAAAATAGCAVRPASVAVVAPPAAQPALSGQDAAQVRAALLGRLSASGLAPPPRIEQTDAAVTDASGASLSVPVMRVSFPEQVFFDFDRDALWPDAGPVCDLIADSIRRDVAGVQVTIVGHTDAIGSDAYNLDLSRRRALAVMRALLARGVDPGALSTVALGKRQPVAPDDTPAGRAENRRVEFFVSPSLSANLAVIRAQPVQAGFAAADVPPGAAVQVLRPAAGDDGLTLAAIGSIALAQPIGPAASPRAVAPDAPGAAPEPAQGLPVAQQAAPAPRPAPLAETPPAVARPLAPQYAPRAPGAALSY